MIGPLGFNNRIIFPAKYGFSLLTLITEYKVTGRKAYRNVIFQSCEDLGDKIRVNYKDYILARIDLNKDGFYEDELCIRYFTESWDKPALDELDELERF